MKLCVVEEVFKRLAQIWNLHGAGQVIETTAEHPFYCERVNNWLAAGELQIGDRIRLRDRTWTTVEGIADSGRIETVYNFRIADCHTYFVSEREDAPSVWAHNAEYGEAHNAANFEKYKQTLKWKQDGGPYSNLPDSKAVKPGGKITTAQKLKVLEENRKANGGIVRSDLSGDVLEQPKKSMRNITPSSEEWQFDHANAASQGGTNSFKNIVILSRRENRAKSDS